MNITVINGSPKGHYSVTYQTVLYLERLFPQHRFIHLHVGQRIHSLEKDFSPAAAALKQADLVLFSYPVYTFMAPSQLHRFIELVKASGVKLEGKFATQTTTSKHFYDVTAHGYIRENCQDLGMKCIHGLSADMDDLLKDSGREQAEKFFRYVLWCMDQDSFEPLPSKPAPDARKPVHDAADVSKPRSEFLEDVVIITNCKDDDLHLQGMIRRFRAVLPMKSRVVNIGKYPFRGGCLGCLECTSTGKCVWLDGFDEALCSDIFHPHMRGIVYAFTIRDHSMGADFKRFDDRQFCNGHRTVNAGIPIGYIVSGDYRSEANLQMVIQGRCEMGCSFLAGVATDEEDTDAAIDRMASALFYIMENRYTPPQNFLGVGGSKIFRDLIYLMRGMMPMDHRFFKTRGLYDFPYRKKGAMLLMYIAGWIFASPRLKKKLGSKISEAMIAPYKKVINSVGQEGEPEKCR